MSHRCPDGDETRVVIGIDAGGSSTRARAVRGGRVVFDGRGGPGNPATAPSADLAASFAGALDGCPAPHRVAACVAGAGSLARQEQVRELLQQLLPGAIVAVYPDYWAPLAASRGADICVVAGTGSIVCSSVPNGGVHYTGGRGWILGDPGSAAALGRAVLSEFVDVPTRFDEISSSALLSLYECDEPITIVRRLHSSANPAADLALAAPVLTDLAERGMPWAEDAVRAAMTALARLTARHLQQFVGADSAAVALSGGVWNAAVARNTFAEALAVASPGAVVTGDRIVDPTAGAVDLALAGSL